jgi:ribulose-phosphate 3-epimerase
MAEICPTVTAYAQDQYNSQMELVAKFAHRIQIDLMDGMFTKEASIAAVNAWWPVGVRADFHFMYNDALAGIKAVADHKPNLVIVHAEATGVFSEVKSFCQEKGIKIGIALLGETDAQSIIPVLADIDHVLIFSGNLGYQGGSTADFGLLEKVKVLKSIKPDLEIGWDGGVNDQNVSELVTGGVDVLNVGGFIQNADNPERAFKFLQRIANETSTT